MPTEESVLPIASWWGGTASPEIKPKVSDEQQNKIAALESELITMKQQHADELMKLRKVHADEVATLKTTVRTLEALLDKHAPAALSVIPPPLPYAPPPPPSPPLQSTVFITAAPPRPQPSTPTASSTQPANGLPLASFLTALTSASNSTPSDPITEFLDKQRIKDIQVLPQHNHIYLYPT